MALVNTDENPKKHITGGFEATAGQTIKLETTPAGEELITELVPEGETWTVAVDLQINRASS